MNYLFTGFAIKSLEFIIHMPSIQPCCKVYFHSVGVKLQSRWQQGTKRHTKTKYSGQICLLNSLNLCQVTANYCYYDMIIAASLSRRKPPTVIACQELHWTPFAQWSFNGFLLQIFKFNFPLPFISTSSLFSSAPFLPCRLDTPLLLHDHICSLSNLKPNQYNILWNVFF